MSGSLAKLGGHVEEVIAMSGSEEVAVFIV